MWCAYQVPYLAVHKGQATIVDKVRSFWNIMQLLPVWGNQPTNDKYLKDTNW